MSAKHKYYVSFCVRFFNTPFNSLEDAKFNVITSFTRKEAIKYHLDGEEIGHFIGDRLHSITPIHVDEHGDISFGRTKKYHN